MPDRPGEAVAKPVVRWVFVNTGEVKERWFSGRDPVVWSPHAPDNPTGEPEFRGEFDEWEATALELALGLVPDLEVAIDMARLKGQTITVRVEVESPRPLPGLARGKLR